MIVNMENLGESLKQMRSEVMAWEQEDTPMETGEDRQYQQTQEALLEEVSLPFPHMGTTVNPSVTTPLSMPIPVATPILSETSTSSLPEDADKRMKEKLDVLRQPAVEENPEKLQKNTPFSFGIPTNKQGIDYAGTAVEVINPLSTMMPYPGLDGHQCRITPIPISLPSIQPIVSEVKVRPPPTLDEVAQRFRDEDAADKQRIEKVRIEQKKGWE